MTSSTKGYLIIAGIVLYHIAAVYGIMMLLDCHLIITNLAALVWLISLPITLWKSSKFAERKTANLNQNVSNLFDNSKE
jgi:hypothetical protein